MSEKFSTGTKTSEQTIVNELNRRARHIQADLHTVRNIRSGLHTCTVHHIRSDLHRVGNIRLYLDPCTVTNIRLVIHLLAITTDLVYLWSTTGSVKRLFVDEAT